MDELIKITTNEEGQRLVSARELHKGLEIKTRFSIWFSRMIEYGFEENIDYIMDVQKRTTNNPKNPITEFVDYIITLDMAKEISMIQRSELGKQFRQYFIECEKKLKEVTTPKLPQTYKEALIELVKTIEEKERIEEEKNKLIHQGKLYTATEIAKEVGFRSATAFNKDLEEKKIQYKCNNTWVLNARYAELGYVSIKQIELDNGRIIYDRKFTGKGRDWLINKIYNKSVDKI